MSSIVHNNMPVEMQGLRITLANEWPDFRI